MKPPVEMKRRPPEPTLAQEKKFLRVQIKEVGEVVHRMRRVVESMMSVAETLVTRLEDKRRKIHEDDDSEQFTTSLNAFEKELSEVQRARVYGEKPPPKKKGRPRTQGRGGIKIVDRDR